MSPRSYYAIFMVLSLAVFIGVRHFMPRPPGLRALPLWKRGMLAAAGFIGGIIGAKLPFTLGAVDGAFSVAAWLQDGKTITTGLIGAYLGVEIAKFAMGIRVKTGDTFALPLALAMAVGRLGCFFNGCCYGTPTNLPWGVDFGDHIRRHPTQLYESVFHLTMAFVLWQFLRHRILCRQQLKLLLITYGVYRFASEYIRPEAVYSHGLTFYQWVSLALIAGMTLQWLYDALMTPVSRDALAERGAYSALR